MEHTLLEIGKVYIVKYHARHVKMRLVNVKEPHTNGFYRANRHFVLLNLSTGRFVEVKSSQKILKEVLTA